MTMSRVFPTPEKGGNKDTTAHLLAALLSHSPRNLAESPVLKAKSIAFGADHNQLHLDFPQMLNPKGMRLGQTA